jgi:hypothetical protein
VIVKIIMEKQMECRLAGETEVLGENLPLLSITKSHWVFGLCPSSSILGSTKHDVSETASVSVLRCGGKTPTQLGPLDRPNLKHWRFW